MYIIQCRYVFRVTIHNPIIKGKNMFYLEEDEHEIVK